MVSFQICKRRSKMANVKSPGPPMSTGKSSHRPYKHLILLPFSAIKRVVDICETPGELHLFSYVPRTQVLLWHNYKHADLLFCCFPSIIIGKFWLMDIKHKYP